MSVTSIVALLRTLDNCIMYGELGLKIEGTETIYGDIVAPRDWVPLPKNSVCNCSSRGFRLSVGGINC